MCNYSTKVNKLKIRFLYFKINLILFHQTLVKMANNRKVTLLPY